MTNAPYQISVDRNRGFVRIKMSGFWTLATAQSFIVDHGRALRENACGNSGVLLLLDQRAFEVQSADVAQLLARIVMDNKPLPRKVAAISNQAILRMQGRRMKPTAVHAWFDDETEALNWLLTETPS